MISYFNQKRPAAKNKPFAAAATGCNQRGTSVDDGCLCDLAYTGDSCQYELSAQCNNLGYLGNDSKCHCVDLITGDRCELTAPIQYCNNHGLMSGEPPWSPTQCTCSGGWHGSTCQLAEGDSGVLCCDTNTGGAPKLVGSNNCSGAGQTIVPSADQCWPSNNRRWCNWDGSDCTPITDLPTWNSLKGTGGKLVADCGTECKQMQNCPATCSDHGTCVPGAPGGCSCTPNWSGPTCTTCGAPFVVSGDNCICDPATVCHGHGACGDPSIGQPTCLCSGNWSSWDCSACPPPNVAYGDNCGCPGGGNCSGHGTCGDDGSCDCDTGYANDPTAGCVLGTGKVCPGGGNCSGHGTCTDGTCACRNSWEPTDCSTCPSDKTGPDCTKPPPAQVNCCNLNTGVSSPTTSDKCPTTDGQTIVPSAGQCWPANSKSWCSDQKTCTLIKDLGTWDTLKGTGGGLVDDCSTSCKKPPPAQINCCNPDTGVSASRTTCLSGEKKVDQASDCWPSDNKSWCSSDQKTCTLIKDLTTWNSLKATGGALVDDCANDCAQINCCNPDTGVSTSRATCLPCEKKVDKADQCYPANKSWCSDSSECTPLANLATWKSAKGTPGGLVDDCSACVSPPPDTGRGDKGGGAGAALAVIAGITVLAIAGLLIYYFVSLRKRKGRP